MRIRSGRMLWGSNIQRILLMISISAIQPSHASDASKVGLHHQHGSKQASKQASNKINDSNSDINIRIAYQQWTNRMLAQT